MPVFQPLWLLPALILLVAVIPAATTRRVDDEVGRMELEAAASAAHTTLTHSGRVAVARRSGLSVALQDSDTATTTITSATTDAASYQRERWWRKQNLVHKWWWRKALAEIKRKKALWAGAALQNAAARSRGGGSGTPTVRQRLGSALNGARSMVGSLSQAVVNGVRRLLPGGGGGGSVQQQQGGAGPAPPGGLPAVQQQQDAPSPAPQQQQDAPAPPGGPTDNTAPVPATDNTSPAPPGGPTDNTAPAPSSDNTAPAPPGGLTDNTAPAPPGGADAPQQPDAVPVQQQQGGENTPAGGGGSGGGGGGADAPQQQQQDAVPGPAPPGGPDAPAPQQQDGAPAPADGTAAPVQQGDQNPNAGGPAVPQQQESPAPPGGATDAPATPGEPTNATAPIPANSTALTLEGGLTDSTSPTPPGGAVVQQDTDAAATPTTETTTETTTTTTTTTLPPTTTTEEPPPISKEDLQRILKWMSKQTALEKVKFCWRRSYGRGVGVPISTCPPDQEQNGALCYPRCKPGYGGAGPVCWQQCSDVIPDFTNDDGALCRRNAVIIGSDRNCPWYDVCGLTFARGCSKCGPGFNNDGCTCRRDVIVRAKASYGRGAGSPLVCQPQQQYDAGLCYTPCQGGFHGVGPVCWQNCPSTQPFDCAAGCAKDQGECASGTAQMVFAPLMMIGQIALTVLTAGASAGAIAAAKVAAKGALKTAASMSATAAQKAAAKAALAGACKTLLSEMAQVTSKRIVEVLMQRLQTKVYEYVGVEFMKTMLVQDEAKDADAKAKEALEGLTALDPTGVADVVQSFNKPSCDIEEPFPEPGKAPPAPITTPPNAAPPSPAKPKCIIM